MFGWEGPRPEWAPPSEWVGMRNDETIQAEEYAVEFQRVAYKGQDFSWLAVYRASLDLKFGDRGNHAGIGLWMPGQWIKHGESMLNGLRQLADLISDDIVAGNEPENVASHIADFIGQFAPMYLYPEHNDRPIPFGLKAGGALGQTKTFGASGETPWRDTGERIETLAVIGAGEACRVLVRIGGDVTKLPAVRPEDVTGHVLDLLPRLTDAAAAKLTLLEAENANFSQSLVQERANVQQLRQESEELRRRNDEATARINDLDGKLAAVDIGIPLGMQSLLNSIDRKIVSVEALTQKIDGAVRNVSLNARSPTQPIPAMTNPNPIPQYPAVPGTVTALLVVLLMLGIGSIGLQFLWKDRYAPQLAGIQAAVNGLPGVLGEAAQHSVDPPSTQSTSAQTSLDGSSNGSERFDNQGSQSGSASSSMNGTSDRSSSSGSTSP